MLQPLFRTSLLCSLFFGISVSTPPALATSQLDQDAAVWAAKISASNPSDSELTLLLNLLYYSYARSQATIDANRAILHHLILCKQITQNCLGSRLNPKNLPFYATDINSADASHSTFITSIRNHQQLCATYARTLEHILDGHALNPATEDLVQELRSTARLAMAYALSGQITNIQQASKNMQRLANATKSACDQLDLDNNLATRGVFNILSNLSPLLALKSFVKFDKQYNACNDKLWKSLITSHTLSDIIWHAFEHARAEIYKAHYRALYHSTVAGRSDVRDLFNEYGLAQYENQYTVLPTPEQLN